MTIFNRLKQVAEQAVEGASRGVDHLKLQSELGNVETQMERAFAEAGKRARYLYIHKQIVDRDMEVVMGQVDMLEAQAMDLRARIQAGQQPAPQPAAPAPAAPVATPPPGTPTIPTIPVAPAPAPAATAVAYQPPVAAPAPVAEQEPMAEPEAASVADVLCPECGAKIPESAKFCGECGSKLG